MILEIPNNLHGLFLVEPLQLSPSVDGWAIVILAVFRVFFFTLTSYFIQATYIVRLHSITHKLEGGECKHDLHIEMVCTFVLVAAGFEELRAIIDFAALLYAVPVVPLRNPNRSYASVRKQHGEVFDAAESLPAKQGMFGLRAGMKKMVGLESNAGILHEWRLDGASYAWKSICFCAVVIPRLLICAALIRVAAGFIMRNDEEVAITSTVGALFVLEICSFLYKAFITNEVKQHLGTMEGVKTVTSTWIRMTGFVMVHFVYPLLCVACAGGLVYYFQERCEDGENHFFSSLFTFSGWKDFMLKAETLSREE